MVVWNTFQNDARVLKEAQTLGANGHEVTVHALHTPGVTECCEELPGNVRVQRVVRSPFWGWRRGGRTGEQADGGPGAASQVMPNGAGAPNRSARLGRLRRIVWVLGRSVTHLRLLAAMVRMRPDVVHAHDVNTLPTAWLAARLARARLVYDAHEISTSREGYQSFRRLVVRVERWLLPRADGVITTTDRRAAFFARVYHVRRPVVLQNRPRHRVVPPGSRIRDELGLDSSRPVVLYQGGLQPGRGLDRIVAAATRIPGAAFVFIGGGRMAAELAEQVDTLGLGGRVRFIPTVSLEELPLYTASADIGVQALENTCLNHFTTDSNKLFEYIAAGLPVVASDFPEIRKIVRTHEVGLLVPSDDTDALVEAIERLVRDEALRARFAANARLAAAALNWEEQEHKLVELYQHLF
ncbi:glycosyltransferase family 4 protein [Thioalkalivibrio sp. ALJT]|uniref:glycosyltransferase family 4 protein n=1 Tax=Thioalkalivibrio sp. ALJT TaxID=1158146 RepID=UPI0009DA71F1|nr:glycosyltransferase family 4 protein [Thioalkalivibrio sp. ALJT]